MVLAPPKQPDQGPVPGGGVAAPLDLAALEAGLRDTPALGVLTKLSVKNEIDDLLDDTRRFHGAGRGSLDALRVRYDLLVLKVMSLLQDDEPALARDIDLSREALWALLADPKGLERTSARGAT